MQLKVLLPTQILLEETVNKVVAEAGNGSFCLLPHHIDFVTALVPGLFSFVTSDDQEQFIAVDEGILVKKGSQVLVSTQHAIRGSDLGLLQQTIATQFRVLDDREALTRSAVAKLEANLIRRFVELGD